MEKFKKIKLLPVLLVTVMLLSTVRAPRLMTGAPQNGGETVKQSPPVYDPDFTGIKIDSSGRLVPSAFNKMVTFETGKTPTRTVYVEQGKSGTGTETNPYGTLAAALNNATPGTSILIKPGNYSGVWHEPSGGLHGTEANPIWVGGIPGQEMPVFTSMICFVKGSYIILHDMEVKNVTGATGTGIHVHDGGTINTSNTKGIWVKDGQGETTHFTETHHFIFRNLYVHNIEYQNFKLSGTAYTWFFDNEISFDGNGQCGGIDYVGGHYITIAYNYFHDFKGFSIQMKGGSYEADVYGNLFVKYGNPGINLGQATGDPYFRPALREDNMNHEANDLRVYSNIFMGAGSPSGNSPAVGVNSCTRCYFVNNTVYQPKQWAFRSLQMNNSSRLVYNGLPYNNTISNNIFYGDSNYGNVSANAYLSTYTLQNNFFGATPFLDQPMPFTGTITGNPQFTNAANRDFTLMSTSPAIGKGVNIPFVTEDFTGTPYKATRSIGAIEYYAPGEVPIIPTPPPPPVPTGSPVPTVPVTETAPPKETTPPPITTLPPGTTPPFETLPPGTTPPLETLPPGTTPPFETLPPGTTPPRETFHPVTPTSPPPEPTSPPEKLWGDVDGDGNVDGEDLIALKRYLLDWDDYIGDPHREGYNGPKAPTDYYGDVNGDGEVDSDDYICLKRFILSWDDYIDRTLPDYKGPGWIYFKAE